MGLICKMKEKVCFLFKNKKLFLIKNKRNYKKPANLQPTYLLILSVLQHLD